MSKKQKEKNILPYTMEEVRVAFIEALEIARLNGLNWRDYVRPKFENDRLVGYYVLDETKSTTIRTVII